MSLETLGILPPQKGGTSSKPGKLVTSVIFGAVHVGLTYGNFAPGR